MHLRAMMGEPEVMAVAVTGLRAGLTQPALLEIIGAGSAAKAVRRAEPAAAVAAAERRRGSMSPGPHSAMSAQAAAAVGAVVARARVPGEAISVEGRSVSMFTSAGLGLEGLTNSPTSPTTRLRAAWAAEAAQVVMAAEVVKVGLAVMAAHAVERSRCLSAPFKVAKAAPVVEAGTVAEAEAALAESATISSWPTPMETTQAIRLETSSLGRPMRRLTASEETEGTPVTLN